MQINVFLKYIKNHDVLIFVFKYTHVQIINSSDPIFPFKPLSNDIHCLLNGKESPNAY